MTKETTEDVLVIESLKKLSNLKIDLNSPTSDLENDLKLGLLRGDFERIATPLK